MTSRMRLTCAAALVAAAGFGASTAAADQPEWIRQFGTHARDDGWAVATGPDGSVHVVGGTYGLLGGPNQGSGDAFVITFDRDGSELWRYQSGATDYDHAYGVATDADGNVYMVGIGSLGGPNKGGSDAFVIKFDRDGRTVWRRQPGMTSIDRAQGVATDADGNVYVVGDTLGSLGGPNKGGGDAYVIKFDRDGRTVWKRQPGTTSLDYAQGVATDADGNVYVVGDTGGDAFVIKFDRDGRTVWKRQPGTTLTEGATGVATDADGNVYMVGSTYGSLGGPNKGLVDSFVIKFDRDGRTVWRRQPGTTSYDFAQGVATDAGGNVYVVGYTEGPLGASDPFVLKFDRDGNTLWRDQPGTTSQAYDYAHGVAADADGNAYVVGYTYGSLGGPNQGGTDAFVIKYGPSAPQ